MQHALRRVPRADRQASGRAMLDPAADLQGGRARRPGARRFGEKRRMMRRWLVLLLCALVILFGAMLPAAAQQAAAQPLSDTPEAFTQALTAWAAKHKVKKAVIVVRREGRVVHQG